MSFQTPPQPFRIPEGLQVQASNLADFERFYRACLRKVVGQRLRSTDLGRLYDSWAEQHGGMPIGFKEMKVCMALAGHDWLHTNGIFYRNVGRASDYPEISDNLAPIDASLATVVHSRGPRRRANLEAVLSGIWAELTEIRCRLVPSNESRRSGRA